LGNEGATVTILKDPCCALGCELSGRPQIDTGLTLPLRASRISTCKLPAGIACRHTNL
jgi:hypothetical protein